MALSRNGKVLAASSISDKPKRNFVMIWDPAAGKTIHDFKAEPGQLVHANQLALAGEGKFLAANSYGQVRFWDTTEGARSPSSAISGRRTISSRAPGLLAGWPRSGGRRRGRSDLALGL